MAIKLNANTKNHVASSSHYISITLKGGPFAGQQMRVPSNEFYLELSDRGQPVTYRRFNSAPVFHCEDRIVAAFGGGR